MSGADERRHKRLLAGEQHAVIQCPRELIDVTLAEAQALAARSLWRDDAPPTLTQTAGGIEVRADGFRYLIAAALGLTTARDILWILADDVRADTIKACLRPIETTGWGDILPPGTKPKVRVQATASRIFHEGRLTEQIEALLPPGSEEFGLIDVRLMDNRLRLAVSLGGEPLYRRRFKPDLMGKASIKEDLAATLTRHALTFAGPLFRPDVVLVPFAGSGTLGYEAILAASQVPPCALAGGRAIERMPCVPAATLAFARKALAARERHALTVHYIEADPEQTAALERGTATFDAALQSNGINAPTHVITTGDATKPWPVTTGAIFVPVNPPYGHRLADKRAAMALYEATVRQLDGLAGRPAAGFVLGLGDDTRRVVEKGLQRWRTELRAIRHGGLPVWALFFASR